MLKIWTLKPESIQIMETLRIWSIDDMKVSFILDSTSSVEK